MIMNMKSKKVIVFIGVMLMFSAAASFLVYNYSRKEKVSIETTQILRETKKQKLPSEIINLKMWKLTVPAKIPDDGFEPVDILQPELDSYSMPPWFMVTQDSSGVVFRAPVNASTTKNSDYPRSELREMKNDGTEEQFWSSTEGTHALFIKESITSVPKEKKAVVAGQIHGDDDDLLTVRLEDRKLFIARSKQEVKVLDPEYVLGRIFSVKFVAENGEIKIYYNNSATPVASVEKKVKQAYFKAGAYTQSNCETEGSADLCNESNYGEVIIYDLEVKHE